MNSFNELKRLNVIRVGIAYTVAAWLLLQLTEVYRTARNRPRGRQNRHRAADYRLCAGADFRLDL